MYPYVSIITCECIAKIAITVQMVYDGNVRHRCEVQKCKSTMQTAVFDLYI